MPAVDGVSESFEHPVDQAITYCSRVKLYNVSSMVMPLSDWTTLPPE